LKYRLFALVLIAILFMGSVAYIAPCFLVYADKPVKSDAVVLFVGPALTAREKEAVRLLYEGYGRFLIIPAYKQVISHEKITGPFSGKFKAYPDFYERTHIEMLYAEKIMHAIGVRSAIMVSSPYHMKRISMIAGKVFGEQARLFLYVPTRYESNPTNLWNMDYHDWMFVMSEYIKICWFQLYSPFINN
jgi:hypothetical protein